MTTRSKATFLVALALLAGWAHAQSADSNARSGRYLAAN